MQPAISTAVLTALRLSDDRRPDTGGQIYPPSWGEPPDIQTQDHRVLPGGYGYGSSTLAAWIASHMKADNPNRQVQGRIQFPVQFGAPPSPLLSDFVRASSVRCKA